MYLARRDPRVPGKTVVYHADNLSEQLMCHFLFLSAMKNINILRNITGSIGDFHDLYLPLLNLLSGLWH